MTWIWVMTLMFMPTIIISLMIVLVLDNLVRVPRVVTAILTVISAPAGSLIYFYVLGGAAGLQVILLVPLFLTIGLVVTPVGLKISEMIRDLRGHDNLNGTSNAQD